MDRQQVETCLQHAIDRFRRDDQWLLDVGAGERSVSHRLALHLQAEFPEWVVDCEYNRVGDAVKALKPPENPDCPLSWYDEEAKTVFPDIIVHRRGKDGPNLLVIEMKKTAGARADFDRDKLRAFTSAPLWYRFGVFIPFTTGPGGDFGQLEWFPASSPAQSAP